MFRSYSRTSTAPAMVRLSGVTWQARASTSTTAARARRSASPKAGWVRSLGEKKAARYIWMTKHTAASYPAARQAISSSRCFTPRSVGASGK